MPLIKSLKIGWLSPQRINQLSFGNITNHKVINARTLKPEQGGLFDPKVFGPSLNYECYCGKYKGKENKGQKCERCEVLIAEKNLQRWRMGHITLDAPITNIALFKILAPSLTRLLGIPTKKLEEIIYLKAYVVIDNGLTNLLKKGDVLEKKIDLDLISNILQEIIDDENSKKDLVKEAKELNEKLKGGKKKDDNVINNSVFLEDYLAFLEKNRQIKIWTGTEAFRELIAEIDVEQELAKAKKEVSDNPQKANSERLKFLQALQKNGLKLEWMIITDLPVIPCGLRPVTKIKNEDVIANNQINNYYRRIILRNERLKYHLDLNKSSGIIFQEIIYNEKRGLQKAVDQLIYGSAHKQNDAKSLLQNLSGKEGILRRYSLGKRVDYSARSVIVPNPNLLLDEIGLPVKMALTLFKPFIVQEILKKKIAFTIKEAEQLFTQEDPVIFTLLNKIVEGYPVLANRAPSLHRLSIQGFYPKLTTGNAIEFHPLVTTPMNADFDGDQIAIYMPATEESRKEIKERVLSPHQIIDPKNGHLIDIPNQDMILGIYYLTKESKSKKVVFYDEIENIKKSYELGKIGLHELVAIPATLVGRNFAECQNKFTFTTLGKIIFNEILPTSFPYYINNLQEYNQKGTIDKKYLIEVKQIETKWTSYEVLQGWKKKEIINFLNELARTTPRQEIVEFLDKLKNIGFDYATRSGISISPFEVEEIVSKEKILTKAEKKDREIEEHFAQGFYSEEEKKQKRIEVWEDCKEEIRNQMINNLIKKENTSFYHIWLSGARASDESLNQIFGMRGNTTNYLGEVIETPIKSSLWEGVSPFEFFVSVYGAIKGMIDIALKTAEAGYLTLRLVEAVQGLAINSSDCGEEMGIIFEEDLIPLGKKVYGRYLAQDILNKDKEIILTRNSLLLEEEIKIIENNKITKIWAFSPLSCQIIGGLCQKCYGLDLSKPGKVIEIGEAVGVIAAQSLGEPGTQLTMRTFHSGGIAGDEDIIQGLPKVKQIFDNVKPDKSEKAVLAKSSGKIISIEDKLVKQKIDSGEEIVYHTSKGKKINVEKDNVIEKGKKIVSGKIDLVEYLETMGRDSCQNYIKREVGKVYNDQGIDINEKHIEIFARQMLSKVEITNGGDSEYLIGDLVNYQEIININRDLLANKKKPISFKNIISSLKDLASTPDSFLAGISFQNTLKSLVNYSLYQPIDYLKGSKESLIAGQMVPVGPGFKEREKFQFAKSRKKN
ncbi:MAG: DNA-directed RNA polymerase subunit beta' [Mycoplasmataceae bacterium]|nr:MAG: DNA-directed RNA polymerase subunit beta' [Mycoplasmataceae bacterium]